MYTLSLDRSKSLFFWGGGWGTFSLPAFNCSVSSGLLYEGRMRAEGGMTDSLINNAFFLLFYVTTPITIGPIHLSVTRSVFNNCCY